MSLKFNLEDKVKWISNGKIGIVKEIIRGKIDPKGPEGIVGYLVLVNNTDKFFNIKPSELESVK